MARLNGAHVEILEGHHQPSGTPVKPDRVLVNGHDVGLVSEAQVVVDRRDVVRVRLELLPTTVAIRSVQRSVDWKPVALYSGALLIALYLGRK